MKVTQDMVDQAEAEYAMSFDMRKALSSALEDVPSNSITAFLDAILEDPEAMERIGRRTSDPYFDEVIEALKQEAER